MIWYVINVESVYFLRADSIFLMISNWTELKYSIECKEEKKKKIKKRFEEQTKTIFFFNFDLEDFDFKGNSPSSKTIKSVSEMHLYALFDWFSLDCFFTHAYGYIFHDFDILF